MGKKKRKAATQQCVAAKHNEKVEVFGADAAAEAATLRLMTDAFQAELPEMRSKTIALLTQALWEEDGSDANRGADATIMRVMQTFEEAGYRNAEELAEKVDKVMDKLVADGSDHHTPEELNDTHEQVLVTKVSFL